MALFYSGLVSRIEDQALASYINLSFQSFSYIDIVALWGILWLGSIYYTGYLSN